MYSKFVGRHLVILDHYYTIQGQSSISRSNMTFQQIKVETTLIPHFCVILTAKFISGPTFFLICIYLQKQKVNVKVKYSILR